VIFEKLDVLSAVASAVVMGIIGVIAGMSGEALIKWMTAAIVLFYLLGFFTRFFLRNKEKAAEALETRADKSESDAGRS
jgi:hypothetical protein